MRILHNIYSVGPGSFGLGPVALNLTREQNNLGHEAEIWCVDSEHDCFWAAETSGLPLSKICRFGTVGPRKIYYSPEMEHRGVNEAQDISIVHQHALWTGQSRVTNKMRQLYKIPTVISPHGSLEKWALKRSSWKKWLSLAFFEKNNLNRASCLHACSEQEIEGIRTFGLTNPVAVIPNGISDNWLVSTGERDTFRKDFCIPQNKRIILFLSRITPVKGLPMLMEALHMVRDLLKDWLVVIAGADEFNHKAEVQAKIRQFCLDEYILFTGLLIGQNKRNAFSEADLFILPTKKEASPVVVLEALGAGVPVLTTKGAPWAQLVAQKCGWWSEINAESIAVMLRDALNSTPDELRSMGQRGKELVATEFTWAKSARMTIELYKWLLDRGKKPDFVFTS